MLRNSLAQSIIRKNLMKVVIEDRNTARFLGVKVPLLAAIIVALVGLLVIIEWLFQIKIIAYTSTLQFTFKMNTAICFLSLGLSLWLWQVKSPTAPLLAKILSIFVAFIGFLTIAEYALNTNLGIDELIVKDLPNAGLTSNPGRMSPLVAFVFILTGIGLFLWNLRTNKGLRPTEFLAFAVLVFSSIVIIGYLYGAVALYRPTSQTGVALHSGISLFILSLGMLAVKPERGLMAIWFGNTRGGTVLRVLLPMSILGLLLFNWISEMATRLGWFSSVVDAPLAVILSAGFIACLIWWSANAIHESDLEREKYEAEREKLLQETEKAREFAEQANRLKDEFLAIVSHELRTPLNAILGWANVYRIEPNTENMTRLAEVVQRQGKHQLQLIEDLLDSSRIITGNMKLQKQPLSLRQTIENSLDIVRPLATAKGLELSAEFDTSDHNFHGDPQRLEQIFLNLLSNAVKFTPQGGNIKIALQCADSKEAKILISDTGDGIAPEFIPYIFERFRQADQDSKRRYGGLGLGLAIVKSLIELHGGNIEVESEGIGKGTIFTVRLPLNKH